MNQDTAEIISIDEAEDTAEFEPIYNENIEQVRLVIFFYFFFVCVQCLHLCFSFMG